MNFKSIAAYFAPILAFIAISLVFVSPVLDGKVLRQGDILQHEGSAREVKEYREKGEQILWTNSMFSGMPAYMISVEYKGNLLYYINKFFRTFLPHPAGLIFIMLLGFYIMLITIGVDKLLSAIGAFAFAFSTYFIIVIVAGHNAKVNAIAYAPPIIGGLIYAYRKSKWTGAALIALFLGLALRANHPQMTYYFGFIVLAILISELIYAAKNGLLKGFITTSGVLLVAVILAVGSHYSYLKTTLEYSKHTIRGKSELTFNQSNQTSGLDRDYITQWSYGIGETMTLLIPNFKGGESGRIGENETALKNIPRQYAPVVSQMNSYWGDQPFTAGPVYVGAFVLLLFLFGVFVVKDRIKIGLLVVLGITVMLSWGKNFMGFTNFFLDFFPAYNKFRAVSSILVVAEFIIPLLGILALKQMLEGEEFFKEKVKLFQRELSFTNEQLFYGVAGFLMSISAIFWLMPGLLTSFFGTGEYESLKNQLRQAGFTEMEINPTLAALEIARKNILSADALRTLIFLALGTGLIYAYLKFKFNKNVFVGLTGAIIAVDLWTVNARYISEENFVDKRVAERENFRKTAADEMILLDKDIHYRVVNLSTSTFNDATTSYWHRSIGGYHGAKLRRYQELIDAHLQNELQRIIGVLQRQPTLSKIDSVLSRSYALKMLNTKYLIVNPNSQPLQNTQALGNVWFAKEVKWVKNADEEIVQLQSNDPSKVALIDERFKPYFIEGEFDSTATVKLISYHPDRMQYEYSSNKPANLLFSEIYYADGWNAYIDGQQVPHYRSNYVLRGLSVPAGNHQIEFKFEPTYHKDERISLIFSSLLLVMFAGFTFLEFKSRA